ncbi:MAG: aminotransferase class V-fold PLP-dependent enzyme [Actinomycetota bacterium]|nr:aminotransferase class V-fold PLP-dependent enzyme [Actinomycetota bacterium]
MSPTPPPPLTTRDGRPAIERWALDPTVRHLNHSSFGGVPRVAVDAQRRLQDQMHAAPVRWFSRLPDAVAAARTEVTDHLNLRADQFAFVGNASAGCTAVFNSLPLPHGAEIIVTDHGYGAVVMGAQRMADRIGGQLVRVPIELDAGGEEATAAVVEAFTDRTALVVVDHITSATGRLLPTAPICAAARDRGIVSMVDGAHSLMLLPDAPALAGGDYWFGNLHKFGCAPTGSAILVPRLGLGDDLYPVIDSWGASEPFPQRFDRQGTLDLTPWLATSTALDEVEQQFGWPQVRSYVSGLADYAQQTVADAMSAATGRDCRVAVGMPSSSMRLVRMPDGLLGDEVSANTLRNRVLAELNIEAAFTYFRGDGYLRLTAHAYNTADDYDDFVTRAVPLLTGLAHHA